MYLAGDWIEYSDTTLIKGVRVPSGTRFGIVASDPEGQVVRIITNGPKPIVERLNRGDVLGFYRPATVKEINERITLCVKFDGSNTAKNALRQARERLRERKAKGQLT